MSKSILFLIIPLIAFAGPSGEKIVSGKVVVERLGADLVQVTQSSPKAIVEWDNFSLSHKETARFIQPSKNSAILNRVVGENLSEIYGRLEGNGKIFVVNPRGIMIGETGRIDCSGFVATGLNVDNLSFLEDGDLKFESGDGKVINRGQIVAKDGQIHLIGADVKNLGEARAEGGIYLQIGADAAKVLVRVNPVGLEKELENPYALAINCEGHAQANYVRKELGRVFLDDEIRVSSAPTVEYVSLPPLPFPNGALYAEETLNSLQQLWSVIPERLWYQRFAILMNPERFKSAVHSLSSHQQLYGLEPTVSLGGSRYYSLQNTVSGDPIRIGDDYQQFLDSPYWKTPDGVEQLINLQNKAMK